MGVGEGYPHRGETINVGCLRLLIATEMPDPMIEIIHGDEEDVGLLRCSSEWLGADEQDGDRDGEALFHVKSVDGK